MANAFKGKEKLAAYVSAANNGVTDLSAKDQGTYGSVAGGSGNYNGEGIPKSITTGGHYNNSWLDKSNSFNGDYKFNSLQVENESNTVIQNFLPDDDIIITRTHENSKSSKNLNLLNISTNIKIDSTSNIKIAANGQLANNNTSSNLISSAYRGDNTLLNNSNIFNSSKGSSRYINSSVFWTKKFAKQRRTLSFMLNLVGDHTNNKGKQISTTNFFNKEGQKISDSSQRINLLKNSTATLNQYAANLTYTEPLTKPLSLIGSYGFDKYTTNSNKSTFDQLSGANFSDLDSIYSSHYIYDQLIHHFGVDFSYSKKKLLFSFGNRFNYQSLNQNNLFTKSNFSKSYLNIAPHAKLTLTPTTQESIHVNYNGASNLPSITQLQPIVDNANPLYLVIGNTDLTPSFTNRFSSDFNLYNTKSDSYFSINGSFNITNNPITNIIRTDTSTGKTIMSYLNSKKKNTSIYGSAIYSFPLSKKSKLNLLTGVEVQQGKFINFINNIENKTIANSYALSVGLNKVKITSYDFNLNAAIGYIVNNSSVQSLVSNDYYTLNSSFSFNYYLPKKFQLHSDVNYFWQEKTNIYTNSFNKVLCNAWFGKKFFSNENLLLKFSANDIFNQNTGFSRNAINNTITQHQFLTIGRNFGLSLIWDFKSFKKVK